MAKAHGILGQKLPNRRAKTDGIICQKLPNRRVKAHGSGGQRTRPYIDKNDDTACFEAIKENLLDAMPKITALAATSTATTTAWRVKSPTYLERLLSSLHDPPGGFQSPLRAIKAAMGLQTPLLVGVGEC